MGFRSATFRSAACAAVIAAGVTAPACGPHQQPDTADATGWRAQTDLPMSVFNPGGIAIGRDGDVYAAEYEHILRLPAGRYTPEQVPIAGPIGTSGIAIGPGGDLYLTDYPRGRILRLPPGSTTPVTLPFTGLGERDPAATSRPISAGVGVDRAGDVFVTDPENSRVLKLPAGSDTPIQVLTAEHLEAPIAVSDNGDIAVTSSQPAFQLIMIPAGTTAAVITTLRGIEWVNALAFDDHANLLLADHRQIDNPGDRDKPWTDESTLWKFPPGSRTPIRLPFTDLGEVAGMAVDPAGDLVVTDSEGERVLRLRSPR